MNAQGHGLGLSISQKIAKQLNGVILVNSEYNKGTTMTFQFSSPIKEVLENNKRLQKKDKKALGIFAHKTKKVRK